MERGFGPSAEAPTPRPGLSGLRRVPTMPCGPATSPAAVGSSDCAVRRRAGPGPAVRYRAPSSGCCLLFLGEIRPWAFSAVALCLSVRPALWAVTQGGPWGKAGGGSARLARRGGGLNLSSRPPFLPSSSIFFSFFFFFLERRGRCARRESSHVLKEASRTQLGSRYRRCAWRNCPPRVPREALGKAAALPSTQNHTTLKVCSSLWYRSESQPCLCRGDGWQLLVQSVSSGDEASVAFLPWWDP